MIHNTIIIMNDLS